MVDRSTIEVELRTVAEEVCELLWLKIILEDLRIILEGPMRLFCETKFAINITHNPV